MPDLGATARSIIQAEIAESSSASYSQEEQPPEPGKFFYKYKKLDQAWR